MNRPSLKTHSTNLPSAFAKGFSDVLLLYRCVQTSLIGTLTHFDEEYSIMVQVGDHRIKMTPAVVLF
ncbi:hypothetical protein JCM17380_13010 [Desulfosporosinus burensis]